jgi:hypothetical protein
MDDSPTVATPAAPSIPWRPPNTTASRHVAFIPPSHVQPARLGPPACRAGLAERPGLKGGWWQWMEDYEGHEGWMPTPRAAGLNQCVG